MIDIIIAMIPGGAWTALAGLATAIIAAMFGAYRKGRKAERARQDQADLKAVREKKEIDDELANLGPADVDERFERYRR
jgi:hypothetical protein